MPIFWAILCGVLFGLLLFFKGFSLKGLTILLLPLCIALRNLVHQRRAQGDWIMRWPKFWEATLLQLMIIGIPASVGLITESYRGILVILGLADYIIVTSAACGLGKKQDPCTNHQEYPGS